MTVPVTKGLVLHLDATEITGLSNNDPVSQWDDLSGNGLHASQTTEASQPVYQTNIINGLPAIHFSNDLLTGVHSTLLQGMTALHVFIIAKHDSTDKVGTAEVMFGKPATYGFYWFSGDECPGMYIETNISTGDFFSNSFVHSPATLSPYLYTGWWRASSTSANIHIDGTAGTAQTLTGANISTVNTDPYSIGNRADGQRPYYGHISEILVYREPLTDLEVNSIEEYLAYKWTASTDGTGTRLDPWKIRDRADLQNIGKADASSANWATGNDIDGNPTSKYDTWTMAHSYKLENDIDLTAGNFTPIGYGALTAYTMFTGSFDGANFKIYNGTINYPNDDYIGVIARSTTGGAFKNLTVDLTVTGANYVAGVVGYTVGCTTGNCKNLGSVYSYNGNCAGVLGFADGGTITDCRNEGSVTLDAAAVNAYAGGIAGFVRRSPVFTSCSNSGAITSNGTLSYVGGIIARYWTTDPLIYVLTIENCFNTGTITGGGTYVGGIMGRAYPITISGCYNSGNVKGTSRVGGIGGYSGGGSISDSYNIGRIESISGGGYIGGILGQLENVTTFTNCYSAGIIYTTSTDTITVTGLAPTNQWTESSATNCYWDYDASGLSHVSGHGTSKTTAEMQTLSTYQAGTGWDIVTKANWVDETWYIDTASYPELGWQYIESAGLVLSASQVGNDIYLSWV